MKLDHIDKKLISLLQNDSKQTSKQLSLQSNLSVTAVYERIKKLEKEGVIKKYVAIIDKEKINKSFLIFCHIKLLQHSKEFLSNFEKEILSFRYEILVFVFLGNSFFRDELFFAFVKKFLTHSASLWQKS